MNRSGGNGVLYALLALGVLMVAGAGAIELMPDQPPDEPPPPAPIAPYVPPPPPPAPTDPLAEEPFAPEPEPMGPMRTVLWHAEIEGETPVACIFGLEISDDRRQLGRAWLRCADGRSYDADASTGRVEAVGLTAGVAFRPGPLSLAATDATGLSERLVISTREHTLSIGETQWFIEELSVPDPEAAPAPLAAVPERLVRLAVPIDVTGWLPVSIGVTRGTGRAPRPQDPVCELTGGPGVSSDFNCRLLLRCRGELVYGLGTTGYNDCTLRDGDIVAAHDDGTTAENSDPRFDLDVDAGRLVVSDVNDAGEPWSATFDLVTDPRLRGDVTFTGGYLAEDGSRGSFAIRPFGTPATVTFGDETQTLSATAGRFDTGEYIVQGDAQERLFFGRGGRAIAGRLQGRTVWGFAPR